MFQGYVGKSLETKVFFFFFVAPFEKFTSQDAVAVPGWWLPRARTSRRVDPLCDPGGRRNGEVG